MELPELSPADAQAFEAARAQWRLVVNTPVGLRAPDMTATFKAMVRELAGRFRVNEVARHLGLEPETVQTLCD